MPPAPPGALIGRIPPRSGLSCRRSGIGRRYAPSALVTGVHKPAVRF
jgi:hypothetical protein